LCVLQPPRCFFVSLCADEVERGIRPGPIRLPPPLDGMKKQTIRPWVRPQSALFFANSMTVQIEYQEKENVEQWNGCLGQKRM
jgi:hypothetical protein